MERSTIYYLKQKGWNHTQIAKVVGCHRDTVRKVLREPVDYQPAARQRDSQVAAFAEEIRDWLDQNLSVRRMLEMARSHPLHPYVGGDTAFYDYVQPLRQLRSLQAAAVAVRYEGLPGELLQIDWGEVRRFPFTKAALHGQTRYFFAARLKYSRWMFVRFTGEMREETLLRCLIACFLELGGVPWAVTSDNMKTITLGRDEHNQPIWHPAFQKFAAEFAFHPSLCAPGAANQKGAVENLVKYVKGNFLAGRSFYDDGDLAQQTQAWLSMVNEVRVSSATQEVPRLRLAEERRHLGKLPAAAYDYGFFDSVLVSRESLVAIATNRYSVPTRLVGQTLTARLHLDRIELFDGLERVASHPRHPGRHARVVVPEHFEEVFTRKPRARVVVYRDWLVNLSPTVAVYIGRVCHKYYDQMEAQILRLYAMAAEAGAEAFIAAVEVVAAQEAVGADYVAALLHTPLASKASPVSTSALAAWLEAPPQAEIERALVHYERYVTNPAGLGPVGLGGGA